MSGTNQSIVNYITASVRGKFAKMCYSFKRSVLNCLQKYEAYPELHNLLG